MCLYYSQMNTEHFVNRKRNSRFVRVYKVFRIDENNKLHGIYFQNGIIKRGWFKSDRTFKAINVYDDSPHGDRIDHGIHVYRTKKYAESANIYLSIDPKSLVIIQCKAMMKDLVAVSNSNQELVFMKIFIPRTTIKKVKRIV